MVNEISQKLKILALADAIIEPEWEYRYFSYNSKWSDTEEMGSLRDGCGSEWFFWLSGNLAGYKCLSKDDGIIPDVESIKNKIPTEYNTFISEPAFSMDTSTCIWYLKESNWIKYGLDVTDLMNIDELKNWDARKYHSWAIDYYEREIDLNEVEKLFNNQFSEEIAKKLNPDIDLRELKVNVEEIGINS